MKVILFGASGMVGQGVLRESLLAADVVSVLVVGRAALTAELKWPGLGREALSKLREVIVPDVSELSGVETKLRDFDACFFCLGVTSSGLSEEDYRRLTYDLTVNVAETLARLTPAMTFVYVSGAGTDSTARGKSMWARVKGATENALLRMPFKAAYMFRPGVIRPLYGIKSKTSAYRLFYALAGPLMPLVQRLFPRSMTTTEQLGRAMLQVAREGYPEPILEAADISTL